LDFVTLVRSRLATLGCAQKDLAQAAQVADSYISQLLTRKRPPPAPDRTDIYPKMEAFLRLEPGALRRLAGIERTEELKHRLGQTPEPLFRTPSAPSLDHFSVSADGQRFYYTIEPNSRSRTLRVVLNWKTRLEGR